MSACLVAVRDTFTLVLFWFSKISQLILSWLDIPTEADVASLVNDWQGRWDPEELSWIAGVLQDILNLLRSHDTARARHAHEESPPQTANETAASTREDGRSRTYRCYSFDSDSSSEFSTASTQVGNETECLTHNRSCKRENARRIPTSDANYFERHVADALGRLVPDRYCRQPREVQELPETDVVGQTEDENIEFDLISFADSSVAEESIDTIENGRSCYAMYETDSESDEERSESVLETCPWTVARAGDSAGQDDQDPIIEDPSVACLASSETIGRSVSSEVDAPVVRFSASEATSPENGKTTALPIQQSDHQATQSEVQDSVLDSWNFGKKPNHIDLRRPMPSLPPRKRIKVKEEAGSNMALLQEIVEVLLGEPQANIPPPLVAATPVQNTCIPFEPSFVPDGVPSQKIVARYHGDIAEEFCSECCNLLSRDTIMDEAPELEKDDIIMIDIVTCVECTMTNTNQWEEVFIGEGISEEYVMVGTPQWDEYIARINPHNECVMTGTTEWDVMFRAWLDGIPINSDEKKLEELLEEEIDDSDDSDEDYEDDSGEEDEEEAKKQKLSNRPIQAVSTVKQPSRYDLREVSRRNLTRQKLLVSQILKSISPETSTTRSNQRLVQNRAVRGRQMRERNQGYVKVLQTVKC